MWTNFQLRKLVEMHNDGHAPEAIAKVIGKTVNGVKAKISFYKKIGLIK